LGTGPTKACVCGEIPGSPAEAGTTPQVCPKCGGVVQATPPTAAAAATPPKDEGIEQILLRKGWVTPEQIAAARQKQQEASGQGKSIRIGEALVEMKAVTPEQVRGALAQQDKVQMRCPTCRKTYNVKGLRAGTRAVCRKCGSVLVPPGTSTDVHAEDSESSLQHVPAGVAVDPGLADLVPGYRIERCLGKGGMGVVYLARQKSLDRLVAIKVLSKELAGDAGYVKRFLAEARSAAKLGHENIVAAVDTGESKGSYYFIMEYVEGETLESLIRRDGAIKERRALDIARQIALGLKHACEQGLIHRDVKPTNVMMTPAGVAKICDFGLARDIHSDVTMTQAGMVHSSPAYSSPEQCKASPGLDHRSDMYSLGISLFEMLTAQLPFKGSSPSALFVQQVTEAPPAPRAINPSISQGANAFVLRLLRKEPEKRFKTYDELLASLDDLRRGAAAAPAAERRVSPVVHSKPSKAPWAIAAGVLLLLTVGAIFMLKGGRTEGAGSSGSGAGDAAAVEQLLKEAKAFDKSAHGRPSEYPAVRAKWKALVERFRGTSHHNTFAGPLLEFESRVSEEGDRLADRYLSEGDSKLAVGRAAEALLTLRNYPQGYQDTGAWKRVSDKLSEIDRLIESRYEQGKQDVAGLITVGRHAEAQQRLRDLRLVVGNQGDSGIEYVRPAYKDELDAMSRRLDEESLIAKRLEAEARQKEAGPKPPAPASSVPAVPPKPPAENRPAPEPATPKLPEPKKRSVPGAGEQGESEKVIRELFKAEYAKPAKSDKIDLARKLIKLARETRDDPAGKYVLLREAKDVGALAGDEAAVRDAIDDLAREYQVDPRAMRESALISAGQGAKSPEDFRGVVLLSIRCADEALAAEDYEAAFRMATSGAAMARRAKDLPLITKADAKVKECEEGKSRAGSIRKSKEALAKNPDDPEANAQVGHYLCTVKEDWFSGLPLLAKGTPGPVREMALRDLTSPSDPAPRMALADGWWDVAEKESGLARAAMRRRAAYWYELAAPGITGFNKVKLEKRIQEAGAPSPGESVIDLLKLMSPKDSVGTEWSLSGQTLLSPQGAGCRIQIPYAPGDSEYDLVVVEQSKGGSGNFEIGLAYGGRQFLVDLDGSLSTDLSGLHLVDGRSSHDNETTRRGRQLNKSGSTIICSVRRTGVSVVVDGRTVIDYRGDYGRLTLAPMFSVPNNEALFLAAWDSRAAVTQVSLRTVSGQGKLLR